jgi:hypothetical protein
VLLSQLSPQLFEFRRIVRLLLGKLACRLALYNATKTTPEREMNAMSADTHHGVCAPDDAGNSTPAVATAAVATLTICPPDELERG